MKKNQSSNSISSLQILSPMLFDAPEEHRPWGFLPQRPGRRTPIDPYGTQQILKAATQRKSQAPATSEQTGGRTVLQKLEKTVPVAPFSVHAES